MLKIGTVLLYPIMPDKTTILLKSLGVKSKSNFFFGSLNSGIKISIANNLFPRIEEKE